LGTFLKLADANGAVIPTARLRPWRAVAATGPRSHAVPAQATDGMAQRIRLHAARGCLGG